MTVSPLDGRRRGFYSSSSLLVLFPVEWCFISYGFVPFKSYLVPWGAVFRTSGLPFPVFIFILYLTQIGAAIKFCVV